MPFEDSFRRAQETATVRTDATGPADGSCDVLGRLYSNDRRHRFVTLPAQGDVLAGALRVDGID
jgi:hypothetical protein